MSNLSKQYYLSFITQNFSYNNTYHTVTGSQFIHPVCKISEKIHNPYFFVKELYSLSAPMLLHGVVCVCAQIITSFVISQSKRKVKIRLFPKFTGQSSCPLEHAQTCNTHYNKSGILMLPLPQSRVWVPQTCGKICPSQIWLREKASQTTGYKTHYLIFLHGCIHPNSYFSFVEKMYIWNFYET